MSPRAPRSNRPLVDTVYCEAQCPDEDVYYFGSDDDQYESSRERKRRYELAGQHFLSGSAPRLFSASLRGPFESSRGWKNPWASKTRPTRITQPPEPQTSCSTKAPTTAKATKRRVKYLPAQTRLDRSECHLPSPQSLKTASLSADSHPFLEDEELQAVQAWRHTIHSTESDAVQQLSPSAINVISPLKRKASHNWLKTVPEKRTRIGSTENVASDRPERHISALPDIPMLGAEQPNPATNDRLESKARFSPKNSTNQLISPPKRSLAARDTARSPILTESKPSDQPSQEQQGAATLSSPVSLRNIKQEKSHIRPSPLKFKVKAHATSDASQRHDAPSPKTTGNHYTAGHSVVQEPYRVPDDEDFVFDIAMAPLSDFSEGEEDDTSQELEHVTKAALEDLQPSVLNEQTGAETDGASDSDLTELSGSPQLSDADESAAASEAEYTDESAEASEAEYAEGLDEMQTGSSEVLDIAETKMIDLEASSECMMTTDKIQVEQTAEVEESSDWEGLSSAEDASEMNKTADASGDHDMPGVATSHSILEETTGLLANESHDTSGSDISRLPQQDAVEPVAGPNTADHVPNPAVAEEESEQSGLCVTETSTSSVAEPVVPRSPKVKQETSEFSLREMFRNLVPATSWAQLTHLTSGLPQSTMQENTAPATMEDHVLPSVEDVNSESNSRDEHDGAPVVGELGSEAEEQLTSFYTSASSAKDGDETCRHSPPEQGSPPASEKPAMPQHQPVAEDSTSITALEQNQTTLSDKSKAKKGTVNPAAVAGVPQESHSPSGREITPTPCSTIYERRPPVDTPATPVTAKTPSPVSKANCSEPRFAFKSFAAFTTPSPERLRVRKRRTLTGSSLRHARLKSILSSGHADSALRTSNRVSWLLPGDQNTEGSHPEGKADVSHNAPSSPPPRTPLADLPTAANEKFAKHFSSVVKRTDGLRQRFHVAADTDRGVGSQILSSRTPSAVAKSKSTVSGAMECSVSAAAANSDAENQSSGPREATLSVEPMDMVEDMVREMGDFWQAWDVDAELSAAKKAQAAADVSASQSRNDAWR
ncbi:hypothetical protein LLEC1_04494 [Akanthomyces lecanii]|uniref:Protamine P1 n=1 Tax=Cordyceps confragosa TaxID=2714763 RepID=A0A179I6P8_CORDF|nr:hypothetical protein LLEC1_04494 [Akanthomyces lecanii]